MITPEKIKDNWDLFIDNISKYISEERGNKLIEFYTRHEERFMLMPASHKSQYHNCFPGGYIDHVNRVVEAALSLDTVWRAFGMVDTYTTEELIFSAINHLKSGRFYYFLKQVISSMRYSRAIIFTHFFYDLI